MVSPQESKVVQTIVIDLNDKDVQTDQVEIVVVKVEQDFKNVQT